MTLGETERVKRRLEAELRIAPEYYDVLRAVDFLLLTAADANHAYEKVQRGFLSWCVSDYLPEEIHAVMAFRLIGALGWDLLEHDASYIPERAKEERIELMLRLIREGIG